MADEQANGENYGKACWELMYRGARPISRVVKKGKRSGSTWTYLSMNCETILEGKIVQVTLHIPAADDDAPVGAETGEQIVRRLAGAEIIRLVDLSKIEWGAGVCQCAARRVEVVKLKE